MRDIVERVARLAKLSIEPHELERYARELEGILKHVDLIQELSLEGVPPTAHAVALECPTRDDVEERVFDPQRVLERAPEHEGTAFKVPRIIE